MPARGNVSNASGEFCIPSEVSAMLDLCVLVYLSVQILSVHVPAKHSREICPHALYFATHGDNPYWAKDKKLLCTIGDHDFYGDQPVRGRK